MNQSWCVRMHALCGVGRVCAYVCVRACMHAGDHACRCICNLWCLWPKSCLTQGHAHGHQCWCEDYRTCRCAEPARTHVRTCARTRARTHAGAHACTHTTPLRLISSFIHLHAPSKHQACTQRNFVVTDVDQQQIATHWHSSDTRQAYLCVAGIRRVGLMLVSARMPKICAGTSGSWTWYSGHLTRYQT